MLEKKRIEQNPPFGRIFLTDIPEEGIDHNAILNPKIEAVIFHILKFSNISREDLLKRSKVSAKTLRKYIKILIKNKFIHIIQQKPMIFGFLVNDVTLWYMTMKGIPVPDMKMRIPYIYIRS